VFAAAVGATDNVDVHSEEHAMQLSNELTVPVGIETAWAMMSDIASLAPCMPGAVVDSVDGDEIKGQVKVKLGPITVVYKGVVTVIERDDAGHRVVLAARANEARGSGTANATITATLYGRDDTTDVVLTTDLDITGKPAQFGRNIMADVSARVIGQFANNLITELDSGRLAAAIGSTPAATSGEAAGGAAAAGGPPVGGVAAMNGRSAAAVGSAATSSAGTNSAGTNSAAISSASTGGVRGQAGSSARPSEDAIDLMAAAGAPVLKRLVPAVAVIALLVALGALTRRRRPR
jgi:carbon monoxide dehydrogenase subunit G